MSRYSFITAYIADPEPQAHPQASPSTAAATTNREPQSADIPSDQQGHRRAQHTQRNINRQTDRTTGASGTAQPMQHRQIKPPNMSKSRGTATYTPESAESWQHSQPADTAKTITSPNPNTCVNRTGGSHPQYRRRSPERTSLYARCGTSRRRRTAYYWNRYDCIPAELGW